MATKSEHRPASKYHTNTYLIAYSIHIVNRDKYKTAEGDPVEKPIDVVLEDMGGLSVMPFLGVTGAIWITEAPARSRSPRLLRDKLRELLDPGDELLIAPLYRPDRVTGVEINEALELLVGMYGDSVS